MGKLKRGLIGFFLVILGCLNATLPAVSSEHANPVTTYPAKYEIRIENGLVFLNVHEVPLVNVLRRLAVLADIRFETDLELMGTVTADIQGAAVDQALKMLCANRALVYEYDPVVNAYKIVAAGAFATGRKEATSKKEIIPVGREGANSFQTTLSPVDALAVLDEKQETDQALALDKRGRPLYLSGEILIHLKASTTEHQIAELHKALGSTIRDRINRFRMERVRLRAGFSELNAIDAYLTSGLVEVAHRHTLRYPLVSPDDPDFPDQWGLANIQAESAWEFNAGSGNVVVAVIDSGVNYQHPDLAGNIWTNPGETADNGVDDDGNGYVDDIRGWDFAGGQEDDETDADADPMDMDMESHGTHVAGIIGARGNNGTGIAGTAWTVSLMPLKVQADDSNFFTAWDIIEAVTYAIDNGADVVNCSYGSEVLDSSELMAFTALRDAGIPVICAAGNSGADTDVTPNYPSSYDLENIISVAAGNETDQLAGFSNYGAVTVDLMAPGVNIRATAYDIAASVQVGESVYNASGMSYGGTTPSTGITGILVACGKGYPEDFPTGVNGQVALIERGKCDGCADFTFYEKVTNAQAAGAVAVIIYNNLPGLFGGTLTVAGNWPPVVSVSDSDGVQLGAIAAQDQPVTVKNTATLYGLKEGTSMAAPFVTGVAALLLARNPSLTAEQVKTAILDNVDKLPALSGKVLTGGKLDARFALCSTGTFLGDMSCNHTVGIEDAVITLKVASAIGTDICPACAPADMDVNADARVGLEEAGYILQRISGVRGE